MTGDQALSTAQQNAQDEEDREFGGHVPSSSDNPASTAAQDEEDHEFGGRAPSSSGNAPQAARQNREHSSAPNGHAAQDDSPQTSGPYVQTTAPDQAARAAQAAAEAQILQELLKENLSEDQTALAKSQQDMASAQGSLAKDGINIDFSHVTDQNITEPGSIRDQLEQMAAQLKTDTGGTNNSTKQKQLVSDFLETIQNPNLTRADLADDVQNFQNAWDASTQNLDKNQLPTGTSHDDTANSPALDTMSAMGKGLRGASNADGLAIAVQNDEKNIALEGQQPASPATTSPSSPPPAGQAPPPAPNKPIPAPRP